MIPNINVPNESYAIAQYSYIIYGIAEENIIFNSFVFVR